jgi:hypothetical protein
LSSFHAWSTSLSYCLQEFLIMNIIDPFTITVILHSSGTFVSGNNTLSCKMTRKIKCIYDVKIFLWNRYFPTCKCPGWMKDRSNRERVYTSEKSLIKLLIIYCCPMIFSLYIITDLIFLLFVLHEIFSYRYLCNINNFHSILSGQDLKNR